MPVSIFRKSYYPFIIGGVVGTVADYMHAHEKCQDKKDLLAEALARVEEP